MKKAHRDTIFVESAEVISHQSHAGDQYLLRVNAPQIKRVRELAVATADPSVAEDAVKVEVVLADGRRLGAYNEHAIGNLARPMSDRDLEAKFRDQATPVLVPAAVEELIASCWAIDELADCASFIAAACRPL